jgi:glycosyltransferase involved in cell wall biosynthesis
MKICFIGKYPPIEGGVSTQSYWILRGLASRGHTIQVVTNAFEVEDRFRMQFPEECDWAMLQLSDPVSRGSVRVWPTEPFSGARMAHIPTHNPFATKLASLATDVIRRENCELIFAYYFEPYGIAAALAATWTDRPYILQHAGSDLDRLMKCSGLATAYQEMIRRARVIITRPGLAERFLRMGVSEDALSTDMTFGLPAHVFSPNVKPADMPDLIRRLQVDPSTFDPSVQTIGIYGKVGETKGSYDLVSALGALRRNGTPFNLLAITNGWDQNRFNAALLEHGIQDRTTILPFVPNWRIPAFVRACSAVCFLERDFPILIHGPMIAREVLACGTCLVLSREIAAKQFFRDQFRNGENVLIVEDPKDVDQLSTALSIVLSEDSRASSIGANGRQISTAIESYDTAVNRYERLFEKALGRPSASPVPEEAPEPDAAPVGHPLERLAPHTSRLLNGFNAFGDGQLTNGSGSVAGAIARLDVIAVAPETNEIRREIPYFAEVVQYERARLQLSIDALRGPDRPYFSATNQITAGVPEATALSGLVPVRNQHSHIEHFQSDILAVITELQNGVVPPSAPQKSTALLMAQLPNASMTVIRINAATERLLELCDGIRTTEQVVETYRRDKAESGKDRTDSQAILAMLKTLYQKNLIVFSSLIQRETK